MAQNRSLVIVESPAKARTIAGFLGDGFMVESSIGHIRDLPKRAAEIPEAMRKLPWARLGVDVENGFKPLYVVDQDKKEHLRKLKNLLAEADTLYLATDEDREGESIAWHLLEVLKPRIPVKRMVFHEITRPAIKKAIESPRELDRRLVDAQEARRILDRLYGYEVSPVLWKKVMPGLSAGRVQSVATRIVVERERARMRFNRATYWDIEAELDTGEGSFSAQLIGKNGQRLATGKDFGESGMLEKQNLLHLDEKAATALAEAMKSGAYRVNQVERKPTRRTPAAPFMTSTLQQEASRKLRFSASRTMRTAQRLYEGGFITYMRTDSTQLSAAAQTAARTQIERMYGKEFLPNEPRVYTKKVKNAQEAHEAIRPAGDTFRMPDDVAREVGVDEARLYELVWMRTIASQMKDALGESVIVKIGGTLADKSEVELSASGFSLTFAGFLRAYVEGSDDPSAELESRERPLPRIKDAQDLSLKEALPKGHETQPPSRYTEAALVQKLEELGVGRPSTYASIIGTITDRGYVWKKGTALVPSFKAFAVVRLLEQHFEGLVDYAFTAKMEDDLDAIAGGNKQPGPWLELFYFGEKGADKQAKAGISTLGLRTMVADRLEEIDARAINSVSLGFDTEGTEVVVRVGRFGPYLQRGDAKVSISEDMPPDELTVLRASELLEAPSGDRELGKDPATGLTVIAKNGRFGPYVQLGEASDGEKPKTSSLLSTMKLEELTLEQAQRLLSLPRVVGQDAEGREVVAQLGRYGAYVTRDGDSRSMEREEQVFDISMTEVLALFAEPKKRRTRAAAEPLKVLGNDTVSGKPMKVMQGRFGPYVTDGETNASLRRDDAVETLGDDRASELLQVRRDKEAAGGGKPKRGAKKPTAKKPAAKKTSSKKTAVEGEASATPKNAASPKKAAAKKPAASKKAAPKKAAAKKTAPKKAASKKPADGEA